MTLSKSKTRVQTRTERHLYENRLEVETEISIFQYFARKAVDETQMSHGVDHNDGQTLWNGLREEAAKKITAATSDPEIQPTRTSSSMKKKENKRVLGILPSRARHSDPPGIAARE